MWIISVSSTNRIAARCPDVQEIGHSDDVIEMMCVSCLDLSDFDLVAVILILIQDRINIQFYTFSVLFK